MDRNDRVLTGAVLAASAAVFVWMTRPVWSGQIPFTGDLLHQHYPLRDFYARAIASGWSFDWMPSLFSGFYVVGEGQLGAYHPAHWLLYRFLLLDAAFGIEVVAAYPFLFAGTWLLLRRWCDRHAAAFGAMLFTFCGFNLSHGVHVNIVSIVAHVPWLLWTIDWTYASSDWRGRARGVAAIAMLTGSQLLLGHPQAVWLSGLIEAGYLTLIAATSARPARLRSAGIVAGSKLLGVVIGAAQVLATLHAVRQSTRIDFDRSYATTFALPREHLLQLIEPYLMWGRVLRWNQVPGAGDELGAYGGAVALLLALWWLASYRDLRARGLTTPADRFGLWALAFGALGLWLALGADGGLYLLQTYLPLVGLFRAPARYVLFAHLALAVAAAIGIARLARLEGSERRAGGRALWAPWCVVVASAVAAAWWLRGTGQLNSASAAGLLAASLGPLLFAAGAGLLTLAVRGARWALVALVLLAAGDQALYGLGGVIAWHDYVTRSEIVDLLRARIGGNVPPEPARIARGGNPNIWVLGGYRTLEGYAAIEPARALDYTSLQALSVAGVQYVHADLQRVAQLSGVEPVSDTWFRIPTPVGRVRLVAESHVSGQPAVDLMALDVARTALSTHDLALPGGPAGTARLTGDAPGNIQVRSVAPSRQLLVVSEAYDLGWTATVDGKAVPVERVNGDFLGCVVPAGEHDVVLRFRPPYVRLGGVLSLSGFGVAALLVAGSLAGWRRRPECSVRH